MIGNLDNRYVRILENLDTKKLPTGEFVRIARIEFLIEELKHIDTLLPDNLKGWRTKNDIHTFWPQNWSYQKIEHTVQKATENIIEFSKRKFKGVTNDGIEIEFYIDDLKKEIETAYIIFN